MAQQAINTTAPARPALCAGCDHVHLDGHDKPCACGCSGFIRSMAAFARSGCDNPNCPECLEDGLHQPAPPCNR